MRVGVREARLCSASCSPGPLAQSIKGARVSPAARGQDGERWPCEAGATRTCPQLFSTLTQTRCGQQENRETHFGSALQRQQGEDGNLRRKNSNASGPPPQEGSDWFWGRHLLAS